MDRLKKHQWRSSRFYSIKQFGWIRDYSSSPFGNISTDDYLLSIFNSQEELYKIFPYPLNRLFLTFAGENNSIRGEHAHYDTYELQIVLKGTIIVDLDNTVRKETVKLKENEMLLIGPNVWRKLYEPSKNNINLFICSTELKNDDYIKYYTDFKEYMLLNAN